MRLFAALYLLGPFALPGCPRHILTEAGPSFERCTTLVEHCSEVHTITEHSDKTRSVQMFLDCHERARFADTCGDVVYLPQ